MDSNLTDKEIQMLNVRCVMGALNSLKSCATEGDLLSFFQAPSDEPNDVVEQEIKRVLELGIMNGFIVRHADKYALTSLKAEYQIDGDEDDDDDDDDDDDVEYISPEISRYLVYDSPTERAKGVGYVPIDRHSPPPSPRRTKRKYTKRLPEPTDRTTRSTSRMTRTSSPASKRRKTTKNAAKKPKEPTIRSGRTISKGKRGGRGRGR